MPVVGIPTKITGNGKEIEEILMHKSRTSEFLISEGIIHTEERQLIEYGLEQLKSAIIGLFITIVLGIVFGMLFQAIIFLMVCIPLRMYAGGYHADTRKGCYFISTIMLASCFWCLASIQWDAILCIIVSGICFLMILFMSPIENDKKALEPIEVLVYKKRTRMILSIESIILVFVVHIGQKEIYSTITINFLLVTISLLVGCFKYTRKVV